MFSTVTAKTPSLSSRAMASGVLAVFLVFTSGLFMTSQAIKAPDLTPPMGWNSYDCYGYGVTEAQFMADVHYMANNYKQYGWQYCIVDYVWWIPDLGASANINQQSNWNLGNMDQYGRFLPDTTRFPSAKGGKGFQALADSVHNLGLKFGIHVMRGVPRMARHRNCPIYNSTFTCTQAADTTSTCSWLDWMWGTNMSDSAGQAYLNSILSLYNGWGVDFIKVDDLSSPYHGPEVAGYANAIASVSREVVFSTSPGPTPTSDASNVMQYANQWRLVNDLWDNWSALVNAVQVAETWRKLLVNGKQISGPGHWLDVDMLPLGHLALYGPVGSPRYSLASGSLTRGEHKMTFFLYCINNGPLIWGGNLPDNTYDGIYDSIMKNSDALFINQHGTNGRVLKGFSSDSTQVWMSAHPTDSTTKFLAFINSADKTVTMSVSLDSLGISGAVPVKDVWTGQSLGSFTTTFSQSITARNAGLYIFGSGSTTGTMPSPGIRSPHYMTGEKTYLTTGSRFVIPACFAGKTVKVATFSLGGKLLHSFITDGRSINLDNNKAHGEQVCIVKFTEVRK